jgi:SAM-dependent methyltransferase
MTGTAPVYRLVDCQNCHTRFIYPAPTAEALSKVYAPHYYGSDWYKHEGKGRVFGRAMLPKEAAGKFLDVGCSLGFFLHGIRKSSDWHVCGVEISPEAVAFAREKLKLDVRCGELAEAGFSDQSFDYLYVNNVLEHVGDPVGFLKECRRILKLGGRLYLSVPNGPVDSASLIHYYQSEKQPARSKDGHLFFFSQKALQYLFQTAGFEIISTRSYGIRRGLRALGYYPRKMGWKKHYRPHLETPAQTTIELPPLKKRLPGYYSYRFWQARLKMLPGLWSTGLDFEIILRAS